MATSLAGPSGDDRIPKTQAALLAGLGVLAGFLIGSTFAAPQLEVDVITVTPAPDCGCLS